MPLEPPVITTHFRRNFTRRQDSRSWRIFLRADADLLKAGLTLRCAKTLPKCRIH
jgi:hypothetical protein